MAGTNLPIPSSLADRIGEQAARRLCREIWEIVVAGLDDLLPRVSDGVHLEPEAHLAQVLISVVAQAAADTCAEQTAAYTRAPLLAVINPEIPDPRPAHEWAQKLGNLARALGAIDAQGNPTREIVRRQGPPELVAEDDQS